MKERNKLQLCQHGQHQEKHAEQDHTAQADVTRTFTFLLAPATTMYSWFLGSVCTSMCSWQQGDVMEKLHIFVL